MDALRITSYNCRSFNANSVIISSLLEDCDVLLLQETLLNDDSSHLLDCLNASFLSFSVPSSRNVSNFSGRSSGGLAFLFRKMSNISFKQVFSASRIQGVQFVVRNKIYLLVNVYCPCDYRSSESFIEYVCTLAEISNLITQENYDDLFLFGDFNCDPNKGRFFSQFKTFYESHSLACLDINLLPNSSYTYISSNSYFSTSWLDHLLVSNPSITKNLSILYNFALEDHIPVYFEITLPENIVLPQNASVNDESVFFVRWDKASQNDISLYGDYLDYSVSNLHFSSLYCSDVNCTSEDHKRELGLIYQYVVDAIKECSSHLPLNSNLAKFESIAGWNDHCKALYASARDKFLVWRRNGSVRSGQIFEEMKSSRGIFKKALKFCRDNQLNIKKRKLLENFTQSNKGGFWKMVSKTTRKKTTSNYHSIDDKNEGDEIAKIFDSNYRSILDDSQCQSIPDNGHQFLTISQSIADNQSSRSAQSAVSSQISLENPQVFTLASVNKCIDTLKTNLGWDFIHSNHLKYSKNRFRRFLVNLFSQFLNHCHMPEPMLEGEIRPILKNNSLSKSSSVNYRPVMNSSCFLKVFEYGLLPFLERDLKLDERQFGFRSNTGCTVAVSVLKETINKYISEGSRVHCAMVDLTKAFDKVNYSILIRKLKCSKLPSNITNILNFMFLNTLVRTNFRGFRCDEWYQGNGVRQGGVLSAILFNFYISSVISSISDLPVGCAIDVTKTNILSYADDIALLAPSASGLQIMLDSLSVKLDELCLIVNPCKSHHIVFTNSRNRILDYKVFLKGNELPRSRECSYLGITLSDHIDIGPDSNRALATFLKQYNSLYSKFSFADRNVLIYLFKSYATSFYGIELWYSDSIRQPPYHKLAVAYHKAIKKMVGLNVWDSNHHACALSSLPIFKHLLARRSLNFYCSLIKSKSPCIASLKYFYRSDSTLGKNLRAIFDLKYGVKNILDHPICALFSRINFVQRNEESSWIL